MEAVEYIRTSWNFTFCFVCDVFFFLLVQCWLECCLELLRVVLAFIWLRFVLLSIGFTIHRDSFSFRLRSLIATAYGVSFFHLLHRIQEDLQDLKTHKHLQYADRLPLICRTSINHQEPAIKLTMKNYKNFVLKHMISQNKPTVFYQCSNID